MNLERTLGGLDVFLPYVRDYVTTYIGKSITTDQWKAHLYAYFETHGGSDKVKALDSIDWAVGVVSKNCFPLFLMLNSRRHGSTARA